MLIIAAKTTFLALARVVVMILKCFHFDGRMAPGPRAVEMVAVAHAIIVTNNLMKITPKIRVSGVQLDVLGVWCWSFPW